MLSLQSLSIREISEELNISDNTVKDHKKRGYKIIKEKF